MASLAERLPDNVPGDFYVDRSCIDCDTCRRIAPETFAPADGHSFVHAQPASAEERRRALMALVACPTASIGTEARVDATPGVRAFPEPIADNVSFCGFTAESSFGAWSYLIERPPPGGLGDRKVPRLLEDSGDRKVPRQRENVLVDSPRAAGPLLQAIDARGGVSRLFLTHRDDVADHAAFRKRFGCERILHARDITPGTRDVERPLSGDDPVVVAPDLVAIPTPGHTRGHSVLLYRDKYLFTGDHLAWSRRLGELVAFRDACWYSWEEQIRSMEELLDFSFEWVLPGHGGRHRASSAADMRRQLERCIRRMKSVA